MCKWLKESNRHLHLLLAIPFGLALTILCVIGLATGMEFKDVHYHNGNKPIREWSWKSWDWLDWIATLIGGVIGQVAQVLLIWLVI